MTNIKERMGSFKTETLVVPEAEVIQIQELHQLLKKGNVTLTGSDSLHRVELPDPLYRLLLRIMGDVLEGSPVAYAPGTQDLTTQQTANLLGMSRQFLVGLLDKGELPFHRVGTHRRVMLKDAMTYRKQRDQMRHAAVNQMAKDAVESGYYDEF